MKFKRSTLRNFWHLRQRYWGIIQSCVFHIIALSWYLLLYSCLIDSLRTSLYLLSITTVQANRFWRFLNQSFKNAPLNSVMSVGLCAYSDLANNRLTNLSGSFYWRVSTFQFCLNFDKINGHLAWRPHISFSLEFNKICM